MELKEFLDELREFVSRYPEWVVLVEGRRDLEALDALGIRNVEEMKGRGYHDLAEHISEKWKGVVILTDLDEKGEVIYRKLVRLFKLYGLEVNVSFRKKLRSTGIRFVEDIPRRMHGT